MWSRILIAAACLALVVGCAKRTAKKPSADDSANAKQPAPAPAPGDRDRKNDKKGGKGDEPNWLTDPRFKKEKEPTTPLPPIDGASPGKQPWAISPPQGGWQGPNSGVAPVQPAAPGAPGMGLLQPQPAAPAVPGVPPTPVKRIEQADMKDVWIYIENASGASGKMPTQKMVYEALLAAKSPAAELVRAGAIYLTGSTSRESIWAFESQALVNGGLVAGQNGVETLTAAELKARLGK